MSKLQVDQVSKTTAGADTFVLPASDGTAGQLMKTDGSGGLGFVSSAVGGKVLQVLQDLLAVELNTTSTSYVATGLSIAITPASASSKFLLFLAGGSCHAASGEQMHTTFFVDTGGGAAEVTPSVGASGYEMIRNNGGTGLYQTHSAMCLHSPSTTNSTTYSVYFKVNNGTGNWQTSTAVRTEFSVMELSS
tara:strand:+ start:163 stop:735 length:573 start_codon:yes stop_codon:yes gene_type:complete